MTNNKINLEEVKEVYKNLHNYIQFRRVTHYKPYEKKAQTRIKDLELCEQTLKKVILTNTLKA